MGKVVVFVALVAVIVTALLWSQRREGPLVVSGFVEAYSIRVGSRVGGRVVTVHVTEGEVVAAGQILVELEPFDLRERRAHASAEAAARRAEYELRAAGFRSEEVAQARARRDQLDANLRRLEKGPRDQEIAAGRAQVRLSEAEVDLAQVDFDRVSSLEVGTISESDRDKAVRQLKVALARLDTNRQELSLLEEGSRKEDIDRARAELAEADEAWKLADRGFRAEEIAVAEAALHASEAMLAAIDAQLAELVIRAPLDGVVESLLLRPGDLVGPDAPVLSLHDPSELWVRAYVPENRLRLKLDDRVRVTVDSFPGEDFTARVGFVAREAEFTPRNVQTPEERSKQVFRIKVYLETGLDRLRPGIPADVWLEDAE